MTVPSPTVVLTTDELAMLTAAPAPGTVPDAYAVRCRWRTPAGLHHFPVTQAAFAALLGVSVATLREWEQNRRVPDAAARRLLLLFDAAPDEMRAALGRLLPGPESTAVPDKC